MEPSGASASALTELIFGSCSSSVLTARESLRTPRFVATTLSSVPFLKSSWLVCVQVLVVTARAVAVQNSVVVRKVNGFIDCSKIKYRHRNLREHRGHRGNCREIMRGINPRFKSNDDEWLIFA